MLAFAYGPDTSHIPAPPDLARRISLGPRMPHPLTGASPESQLLLGMVGRLVLGQRRVVLEHSMTCTEALLFSLSNIGKARSLKHELLSLVLPCAEMVLDPGDPDTSVQDLLDIAEAYRLCALILLYHCYSDLIDTPEQKQAYYTSLAFQVLQILESISEGSGTRTIEAILLVIVSGELRTASSSQRPSMLLGDTVSETSPGIGLCQEPGSNLLITHARSTVLARFAHIQAILPFKTIGRMRSLVLETWRLMDSGSDIFWVDLLIRNNWQFLMQ